MTFDSTMIIIVKSRLFGEEKASNDWEEMFENQFYSGVQ